MNACECEINANECKMNQREKYKGIINCTKCKKCSGVKIWNIFKLVWKKLSMQNTMKKHITFCMAYENCIVCEWDCIVCEWDRIVYLKSIQDHHKRCIKKMYHKHKNQRMNTNENISQKRDDWITSWHVQHAQHTTRHCLTCIPLSEKLSHCSFCLTQNLTSQTKETRLNISLTFLRFKIFDTWLPHLFSSCWFLTHEEIDTHEGCRND